MLDHKLDKLTVVVDEAKRVGWFHGQVSSTIQIRKARLKKPMRVTGVVVGERNGTDLEWKIQAMMYARTIPDAELYSRAQKFDGRAPKLDGDAALAKQVAAWFADGSIAADRSKNVATIVNGTAPKELGTGAGAVKLVTAWDKLDLRAGTIRATTWNDAIAFVDADVFLIRKDRGAMMVLGTVLVKEGDAWRWVSLSFTPAAYGLERTR